MTPPMPPSPNTPGSLLQAVSEPESGHLDVFRLLAVTGLRTGDLAALAGVDADVLSRDPHRPESQEAARMVVQLLDGAMEMTGDLNRALFWFRHQPIEAYRFQTPAALVAEGRADAVLAYLEDLRNGTFA